MAEPTDIVDLEQAAELIPGGPEGVREMAKLLVEESTELLQTMRDGFRSGDAAAIGVGAHTLKSIAEVFGAKAVVAGASILVDMARQGNLEGAKKHYAELEEQVARLHEALESVIEDDPA